jgi:hypothetical protein
MAGGPALGCSHCCPLSSLASAATSTINSINQSRKESYSDVVLRLAVGKSGVERAVHRPLPNYPLVGHAKDLLTRARLNAEP